MKSKYLVYSILVHIIILAILFFISCPVSERRDLKTDINVSFVLPEIPLNNDITEAVQKKNDNNRLKLSDIPKKINSIDKAVEQSDISSMDVIEDIPVVKPSFDTLDENLTVGTLITLRKKTDNSILPDEKKSLIFNKANLDNSGFRIEGDLKNRKIIYKILPKPISNLKEEISLKYKLVVSSSGDIINIIPVKKGNLQAERNAIEALKQWKFSKLPDIEKDSLQSGIITIYFKLR